VFEGRKEQVLHSCDVRNCVSEHHLSVGDAFQNMQDAAERGRLSYGEDSPKAKITTSIARTVKEMIAYGYRNCHIGDSLGISRGTVSNIRMGKAWVRA
jgi:DNA-binding NarL/FixJ family response regulator